jgi:hypothetical protein
MGALYLIAHIFWYFAELRCYFLLYTASIATSVIWYVMARHIEANRHLSWFKLDWPWMSFAVDKVSL